MRVLDNTNVMLYLQFMPCPRCLSEHLTIRKIERFERIIVFFTGKRRYRCRDCDLGFRAQDRRKSPPEERDSFKPTQVA